MKTGHMVAALLGLFLLGNRVSGQPVTLSMPEGPGNAFAGQEALVTVRLAAAQPFRGKLAWRLSSEGRTLVRREQAVTLEGGVPLNLGLRFDAPAVKEGTALSALLEVIMLDEQGTITAASLNKVYWIFPVNAWAGHTAWLQRLKLRVFDPDGKTAAVLEKENIPFTLIRNTGALAECGEGVVLVGEGVSFKDYRGLARSLMQAAAGGAAVLCLAPREGELPIGDPAEEARTQPTRMDFRQSEIVRELDKRLEVAGWSAAGAGIQLRGERGPVVAAVQAQGAGWRWIEMEFADGRHKGRFIVTSLALLDTWAASPAPRYLLLKMLEQVARPTMDGNKQTEKSHE